MINITTTSTWENIENQLRINEDPLTVELVQDVFYYHYIIKKMEELGYKLNTETRIFHRVDFKDSDLIKEVKRILELPETEEVILTNVVINYATFQPMRGVRTSKGMYKFYLEEKELKLEKVK